MTTPTRTMIDLTADKAPVPRRRVILVTHGSMNPIHRGHIAIMVSAKALLESQGFEVVEGVIAITRTLGDDDAVRAKPTRCEERDKHERSARAPPASLGSAGGGAPTCFSHTTV